MSGRHTVCVSVCPSVCALVTTVSLTETAEPIEMPFTDGLTRVGSRNHALDGGCRLPGEYYLTTCARRRCGFESNYLDHLLFLFYHRRSRGRWFRGVVGSKKWGGNRRTWRSGMDEDNEGWNMWVPGSKKGIGRSFCYVVFNTFLPRAARAAYGGVVCPSFCPPQAGIVSKRLDR